MAEEKKDKTFLILLILQGITLVCVVGIGVLIFLNEPVNKNINKTIIEKPEKEIKEITYKLDPFVVNLMDNGGRRYLKVTMDFVVESQRVVDEIERKKPSIKDIIIMVLSGKTFDDIATQEGKIKLRNQIKDSVNKLLNTGKVIKIYFTEFVIQ